MAELNEEKTEWPELQGKKYDEVEKIITEENPSLEMHLWAVNGQPVVAWLACLGYCPHVRVENIFKIQKVIPGQPMTRDFRPTRVRVLVDDNDVVIQTPAVG